MPIYTLLCDNGHREEIFKGVEAMSEQLKCRNMRCDCGAAAHIVITAPLMVKVAADVHYTSPIDERPITSWQARNEDLKRNGCTPYDPEQKTDYARRIKESEASLDKAVESSVEEAIAKMPNKERGKLESELVRQGTVAEVVRTTPDV